jgi:hypothetical protein
MELPYLKELARRREEFFSSDSHIRLMTMISDRD